MRSLHSNREMVTLSKRPFDQLVCAEGETFTTEATPASRDQIARARTGVEVGCQIPPNRDIFNISVPPRNFESAFGTDKPIRWRLPPGPYQSSPRQTTGQAVVIAIFRVFYHEDPRVATMALRCRSLLGPRVKRPRLWGTVLILGAIAPLLLGKGLSSCFISANGECFEAFDQTAGTLLLMVGGLLLLAGLMVL